MSDISQLFWQASLPEIKQGYLHQHDSDEFICLICGQSFPNGLIYSDENQLYEAKKYMEVHIAKQHQSPFHFLLDLDKKLTGLTEHQKTIIDLFYAGHNDNEVAKALNTDSTSTVRNHRFSLREKQKQAKFFLALMELLNEQIPKKNSFIDIPRSSKKIDERFAITEQENTAILAKYFKQGLDGPLEVFPSQEKRRVTILKHILNFFDVNKKYTEQEINAILKKFYDDYVLLRRNLIEYGFMDRTPSGSSYWVKP